MWNVSAKKITSLSSSMLFLAMLSSCGDLPGFNKQETTKFFDTSVVLNDKVDLLFVIDNSRSMLPYQQRLKTNLSNFMQQFQDRELDYRIGVISTDMSITAPHGAIDVRVDPNVATSNRCFNGTPSSLAVANQWWYSSANSGADLSKQYCPYYNFKFLIGPASQPHGGALLNHTTNVASMSNQFITKDDFAGVKANIVTAFEKNIELGDYASGRETPLLAIKDALSASSLGVGGKNENFIRDDAFLAIIVLTDEDEENWKNSGGVFDNDSSLSLNPPAPAGRPNVSSYLGASVNVEKSSKTWENSSTCYGTGTRVEPADSSSPYLCEFDDDDVQREYASEGSDRINDIYARLKELKNNDEEQFVMATISKQAEDSYCSFIPVNQENYTGAPAVLINQLVDLTAGSIPESELKFDICSNSYGTDLSKLSTNIISAASKFYLGQVPDFETEIITVKVNDALIARDTNPSISDKNGWDFDVASLSIKFYGALAPKAGDDVKITYVPKSGFE